MNPFHKKIAILIIASSLILTGSYNAKPVLGENEIRKASEIDFKNRSYRRASATVRYKNWKLGKKLSDLLKKNSQREIYYQQFRLKRILPSSNTNYGADIIIPDEDSEYGHINSLVRIIASYLENTFYYPEQNAYVLAKYILYYNAVHRKNSDYINQKYTSQLTKALDPQKIGISFHYKKWPGNTQIIIPLQINSRDGRPSIPTDEIEKDAKDFASEEEKNRFEKLKEDLQREKNQKSTPQTTDANDVAPDQPPAKNDKNTEPSDPNQNEQPTTKDNDSDIARVDPVQKQIETEKRKHQERENQLKKEINQEKQKKEELENKLKEEEKKKQKTKKDLARQEKITDLYREKVDKLKQKNKAREEEVSNLKGKVEQMKKEQKARNENSGNVMDGKIVFLRILSRFPEGSNFNNEIYLIDPLKDDTVVKSPYRNICSKRFEQFGGHVLVLGCDSKSFRLVLLNLHKGLKKDFQSEVPVYKDTPLIIDKNRNVLFGFEEDKYDHSVYLSKFDKHLKRIAKSKVPIHPDSRVTAYQNKIYVTSNNINGDAPHILIFDKQNLKLIKKFLPSQ